MFYYMDNSICFKQFTTWQTRICSLTKSIIRKHLHGTYILFEYFINVHFKHLMF